MASATADVVENVQRGRGLAHALVYEPGMTRGARQLLDDAHELAAEGPVEGDLPDVEPGRVPHDLRKDEVVVGHVARRLEEEPLVAPSVVGILGQSLQGQSR